MQNSYFIKIIATYSVVILIVLLWSGSNREKSIYDKYLISLGGIEISSNDLGEIRKILIEDLEFDLHSESESALSVILPDKRFLNITLNNAKFSTTNSKPKIHVRVKNGLSKLHKKLSQRLEKNNISEISQNNNKSEFTVAKLEQVDIVFYQKDFFAR